jgi:hypothetical protein
VGEPSRPSTPTRNASNPRVARLPVAVQSHRFGKRSLNNARLTDLERLNQLRGGFREGHRHFAQLFYLTALAGLARDENDVRAQASAFNTRFNPPQSDWEVDEQVKSVLGYEVLRHGRSATILQSLDVTAAEERHLKTLIGPGEKARRLAGRQLLTDAAKRVLEVFRAHPDWTQAALARVARVSQKTVSLVLATVGLATKSRRGRPRRNGMMPTPGTVRAGA